jgi:aminobenzoyl-glutamate utilization protein B
MTTRDEIVTFAHEWIDDNADWLGEFEQEIWDYAEPAWREYRSAEAYVELLRDRGFDVEEGSGDMPTAFAAEWGEGGPVLAT